MVARKLHETFKNVLDWNRAGNKELPSARVIKTIVFSSTQFKCLRVFHDTANLCLRDIFPSLRGPDISYGTETVDKHLLAPKMVLTQYQPRSASSWPGSNSSLHAGKLPVQTVNSNKS